LGFIKLSEFENYMDSFDYKANCWLGYINPCVSIIKTFSKLMQKLDNQGNWVHRIWSPNIISN
jgi:hypothetical protein